LFVRPDINRDPAQLDSILFPTVAADAGRKWAVGNMRARRPLFIQPVFIQAVRELL
jgi:hypothetical protein